MKIQCIKLLDNQDKEQNTSPWLTINSIYIVLEILCYIEKCTSYYRIVTDDGLSGILNAKQFKIINSDQPPNWVVDINQNGLIVIAPKAWQKPGFWEDYYDAEPAALEIYKREARIVYEEEGDHERFDI